MSNTELLTFAPAQPATTTQALESSERASSRLQDVERELTHTRPVEQQLAPVDGGFAAWRLLCAAFVFEALLWGKLQEPIYSDR